MYKAWDFLWNRFCLVQHSLIFQPLSTFSTSKYKHSSAKMSEPSKQTRPLYFWRETDPKTGWLSQWYFCPFKDDKNPAIVYETAEQ